jgi:hypothetical protein
VIDSLDPTKIDVVTGVLSGVHDNAFALTVFC